MGIALTIAGKQFRSFINSPVAYIFLVLFTLYLAGSYFIWGANVGGQKLDIWTFGSTELDLYFHQLPMAFVILVPALSMMLWPDELKSGTVELLVSYPVRSWQVVMGKFMGGFALVLIALLCTVMTPIEVASLGALDVGPVLGSYLGSLLMGGAFLSVGLFMGALCKEQVSAFILSVLVCGLFVVLGDTLTNQFLPEWMHAVSNALSFENRFNYLQRGILDWVDIFYFVSVTALFLILNVTVMECRKGK